MTSDISDDLPHPFDKSGQILTKTAQARLPKIYIEKKWNYILESRAIEDLVFFWLNFLWFSLLCLWFGTSKWLANLRIREKKSAPEARLNWGISFGDSETLRADGCNAFDQSIIPVNALTHASIEVGKIDAKFDMIL